MVAPRALYIIANGATNYVWLAEQSGYVSSRAGEEVYKALGIPDRFGFSHSGHTHCGFPENQAAELNAFVDKFLLGKTANTTGISTNPFASVDYNKWISAWKGQTISPDVTGIEAPRMAESGLRIVAGSVNPGVTIEARGRFAYEVLNHLGQRMESGEAVDRKTLNRNPPSGIYFIKVTQNRISRLVKFIQT
jgi:hypothetical protein